MSDRYRAWEDGSATTIAVAGHTLPELFEEAAFAVFDLSYEAAGIPPTYSRPVVAPGDDRRRLLVNWLNELLGESARSGIAFSLFMVDRLEDGGVQGSASGMPVAETVRRRQRVAKVVSSDEPVFAAEHWTVTFVADMERPLRVVGS